MLIGVPDYRRPHVALGTHFITQVTCQWVHWLCNVVSRQALKGAIITFKENHLFSIDAIALLLAHVRCLFTLQLMNRIFQ